MIFITHCRRGDNSKVFEIPKNFYNVRSNPRQRKSTEGEGGRGTKRLDEVSRVTSQLSSRRNPRPYLFAIYAHLERNLGRAPTAPSTFTTASITRRKNVSLRYVRPPFSLSLSFSPSRVKAGRESFSKISTGATNGGGCIDSQRRDCYPDPLVAFHGFV